MTNVTVTAAGPVPAGTIRFEPGSQIVISAAPVIQFKAIAKNIGESDDHIDVLISKIGKGKVTVKVNTADGTADSGDYTPILNRTLTFPVKTSKMIVPIKILPNTVKDGFRTFTVTLSSPTGGAVLGTKKVQTIGIKDDD